jgi:hypothetical protein
LKITRLLFPQCFGSVFILTKNGLGYIVGDFFTNSSGHPVCDALSAKHRELNMSLEIHLNAFGKISIPSGGNLCKLSGRQSEIPPTFDGKRK